VAEKFNRKIFFYFRPFIPRLESLAKNSQASSATEMTCKNNVKVLELSYRKMHFPRKVNCSFGAERSSRFIKGGEWENKRRINQD